MSKGKLSTAQQENLLTLICFDETNHQIIRNTVEPELFETKVYKTICERAYQFIDSFKACPGDHIHDELEDIIAAKDRRAAKLYESVLSSMYELKESINATYVLDSMHKFVRQQYLKKGILEAVEHVQDGAIDLAESTLISCMKSRAKSFSPGIVFSNMNDMRPVFAMEENAEVFPTGVDALDSMHVCPARGELFVFVAPPNRGKSWFMVNVGKNAAVQRKTVLHITLEMSEQKTARRYVQALYSMTRRQSKEVVTTLHKESDGTFTGVTVDPIERPSLSDASAIKAVVKKHDKLKMRHKIVVKEFPTSSLTIRELTAYLDQLEQNEKIIPDLLIVDYADLFHLDSANLRIDTGQVYKQLRGLAMERNIAVVTASQSNREGEGASLITLKHLAEDYSKAMTADTIVAFCQTQEERKRNLCRLFLAKVRDEAEAGIGIVLLSQAYGIGQFCTESMVMYNSAKYFEAIKDMEDFEDDADEED